MALLISFLRNLAYLLGLVLSLAPTLTGIVVSVGSSIAAFFSFINNDWFGWASKISESINGLTELIDPFMRSIQYVKFYDLLFTAFSLDVFSECIVYMLSIFLGVVVFTCFEAVFFAVFIAVPFFILKGLRLLISAFTVGQVRV